MECIPQLVRALGYPLRCVRSACLVARLAEPAVCSNEELGAKLAELDIQETMEFDEYLALVRALGTRSPKTKEIDELKRAIDMVTKGAPTINVDDLARIMSVVGMNLGEALDSDEVEDFKLQMGGAEEIAVDEFVQILVGV